MTHLRLVLAVAALALAVPTAASAQEPPPDERAAARAFADAGVRFAKAVENVGDDDDALPYRECRPLFRKAARHKPDEFEAITLRTAFRHTADLVREPLRQLRADLANAQTRDPVLLSGRAAWRQAGRALAALGPAGDPCAELRAWMRAGAPSAEGHKALRELDPVVAAFGREYERKLRATSRRLVELGIPKQQAKAFQGED
jgi:hypothetical protein